MKPITRNGRNYTQFYAWYPVRTTLGRWIWFENYYIRPDRYFQGRLLSESEFRQEIITPG